MIGLLSGYQKAWLRPDILAGISVAAVALPVAIAYSQLVGVPPVYGLYASLLPLVAYAFLGSSRQLILAPDAATCAIVASVITPLAGHDSARYLSLTSALAILGGLFCIAAGFAKFGFLTNFLAQPILAGYLNGIALSIIAGQLGRLFGFSVASAGFFRLIGRFLSNLGQTHTPTLVIGLAALALLILLSRLAPSAPAPLIVTALAIGCSQVFGFAGHGVTLLGNIPAGLPAPAIPDISASDWGQLLPGAAALALISFTSAMVTARGFATKNRYDINGNRDFIALGVANIGAGILQGFAISGADSRTAVNDAVGGKSQVTGLVAAALLALALVFLTAPLAFLPMAVLSAVLIKAAAGLFDLRGLLALRRVSPPEFRLCLITLLGTITVGVLEGVLVAIGAAIIMLLIRTSRPPDAVLGRIPGTHAYEDAARHPQAELFPGLVIYRFDAGLLFFNAEYFKSRVKAVVQTALSPVRFFVLDAETIPLLDTTGAASIDQVCGDLSDQGIEVAIAAAKHQFRGMAERSGLCKRIGTDRLFPTVDSAVEALSGART